MQVRWGVCVCVACAILCVCVSVGVRMCVRERGHVCATLRVFQCTKVCVTLYVLVSLSVCLNITSVHLHLCSAR